MKSINHHHTQWAHMSCSRRDAISRVNWRKKAVDRNGELRKVRQRLARRDLRVDRLSKMVLILTDKLEAEKQKTSTAVSARNNVVILGDAFAIRVLCVLLVVIGVVSFRSVPRILRILRDTKKLSIGWIPSFTSAINWTLRAGLARLQSIRKIADPWVAIIDCTIDVSVKKALIVLRVKLSSLADRGSALTLDDCECIGVDVSESWDGESVAAALGRIFGVAGLPAAIIKDQGSDLRRGVRLWRQAARAKKVFVIDDIGHVMANALKAVYSKGKLFNDFLAAVKSGGAKLRQSDLAYLSPPKIRTKGRFQSIMNVAAWGMKIIELLGGRGRQEDGSLAGRLRRFLPHFGVHRGFLEGFAKTSIIASDILSILKNRGLNQETYQDTAELITALPERSKIRKKMTEWLKKHQQIQCRLGIGQMPMPVSSDIIESLIGKFKVILQRNSKAEFNRIVLAIPTLFGDLSEPEVRNALINITHTDLQKWEHENVLTSLSRRRRLLEQNGAQKNVWPSTG